jgi:hypothetical protein
MRKTITRGLAVAAALAVASAGLISTTASAAALPAGAPAAGSVTPAPTSGIATTTITLSPPVGAACPGDTATGGYKWATFILPRATDPATVVYNALGPVGATPLYDTTGSAVVAKNTGVVSGLLTPIPVYNFNTVIPAAGQYNIGYACYDTNAGNATARYWSGPVTFAAGGAYTYGFAPAAPVLSALSVSDQTLAGSFTQAAATPAITSYTVTAHPAVGADVVIHPAAAGAFSIPGLVNGTSYAVTVTVTNGVGGIISSNTVNGTPNPAPFAGPTGLAAIGGAGTADLSWTNPVGETSPRTGYDLVVSSSNPAATGTGTFHPAVSATSFSVTGLTPGVTYAFDLTATYAAPYSGTTASVSVTPLSSVVVVQDISAVRPVGALVMTQVCGSWGAIPQIDATSFFPVTLPPVVATEGGQQTDALGNGTGFQGAAPRWTNPSTSVTAPDANFPAYPYPVDTNPASSTYGQPIAVYPTHCGLNLGTAKLLTNTGTGVQGLSGQYFQTAGQLNQITVVNTDEFDKGWSVKGTVSNFVKSGLTEAAALPNQKFSSNHFGWNPVLTAASANTYGEYGLNVVQGAAVDPLGGGALAAGAFTQKTLGSATAKAATTTTWGNQTGGSLGMAKFDARVKLLIPVWAVSGTYVATLTLSAV